MEQSHLVEKLLYNPDSGVFIWRSNNKIAGYKDRDGYVYIRVDKVKYKAHRLAWLYVYGTWPSKDIDHIDRDKSNNAINNLREATKSDNLRNRGVFKNNKLGVQGVSIHKATNKYQAQICVNKTIIHLGYFNELSDAIAARKEAEYILSL